MSETKFVIIYDTYCGWCYGAAPILGSLAKSDAKVEVLHRYLFQGPNAPKLADGFGEQAITFDARIAKLSGQRFSKTYVDNILRSKTEILESGFTAQAAALVHHKGPAAEMSLAERLQHARYVDGVSAADRQAVVEALVAEGVDRDQAERIGTDGLAAEASVFAARASRIMSAAGARGVPTVLKIEADQTSHINVADFYEKPSSIVELAALSEIEKS